MNKKSPTETRGQQSKPQSHSHKPKSSLPPRNAPTARSKPILSDESDRVVHQAIQQLREERDRDEERERKQNLWSAVRRTTVTVLSATASAVLVLLIHGGMEEAREQQASFARVSGEVYVKNTSPNKSDSGKRENSKGSAQGEKTASRRETSQIQPGDTQITGKNGSSVLTFMDGSVLQQNEDTRLGVYALDFFRSGRRERRFALNKGKIDLLTSSQFGSESETRIITPDALVTASQNAHFRVGYNPDK
ncbi:MAG: hypothetical protein OHK0029_38960 [Armatimonadaceae bacterium]